MLILQSNEKYDDFLKLDPDSGFSELGSRKAGQVPAGTPINGHFVESDGSYVCFYRCNDQLIFRVGKEAFVIPENATASLQDEDTRTTLRILVDNAEICHWTYIKPDKDFIDYLRYMEEEDSDFGSFVHNVINDKARQRRMYR
jgi:hypothetical protein